jgi:predicted oxidoreductase
MLGLDWNSNDFVPRTIPTIRSALDSGVTFFDLADVYGYGKAEMALGQVMRQSPGLRNRIVIQSKCGDRFREGGTVDNSRSHLVSTVEASLQRLGTEHLDVLLLHWPDDLVEPDEVASAFDSLQSSGKVRYFGVSNHSPARIDLLKKSVRQPLVANQIPLGLAHWHSADVEIVDYCRLHDIQVQAYSPLRSTMNLLNPSPDATPEVRRTVDLLAEHAKRSRVTPAAVMLAWLLRHPAGIVPVIGATKPEHVTEGCAAERVELSRVEWYSLLQSMQAAEEQLQAKT